MYLKCNFAVEDWIRLILRRRLVARNKRTMKSSFLQFLATSNAGVGLEVERLFALHTVQGTPRVLRSGQRAIAML